MKILRANLFCQSWVNCLDYNYKSLDPLSYCWIHVDEARLSIWYGGSSLSSKEEIQNHFRVEAKVVLSVF